MKLSTVRNISGQLTGMCIVKQSQYKVKQSSHHLIYIAHTYRPAIVLILWSQNFPQAQISMQLRSPGVLGYRQRKVGLLFTVCRQISV